MFAVVTRNLLRSRRYAVSMVWAWWQVRRQLAQTPGMLAYTTAIANLREFFTLTLWQRELDMYRFMASDAHADMMWNFRRWDESFWSMRWNPCGQEVGSWDHRRFADQPESEDRAFAYARSIPEYLLQYLPALRAQRLEPGACKPLPSTAVVGRVEASSPATVLRLRRWLRAWRQSAELTRFVLAFGAGDCLILAVWTQPQPGAADHLLQSLDRLHGAWAMRVQATDFEIGHWDRLRLRELLPQPG